MKNKTELLPIMLGITAVVGIIYYTKYAKKKSVIPSVQPEDTGALTKRPNNLVNSLYTVPATTSL